MEPDAERDRWARELLLRLGLAAPAEVDDAAGLAAALRALASLPPDQLRERIGSHPPASSCSRCGQPLPESAIVGPAGCPACGPRPLSAAAETILAVPAEKPSLETLPIPAGGESAASVTRPSLAPAATGVGRLGRYHLLEKIGVGGMGVVWKAWDPELGRIVALKQIRKTDDFGPEHVARFQREARLAAKLRHPNIVAIHDVGQAGDDHYLTMEYVDGRTMSDWLDQTSEAKQAGRRAGHHRLREEARLLAEVSEAVAYAHREGVVHRDLKPGNVLLDQSERPFVMDFGLAKDVDTAPSSELSVSHPTLTVAGQVVGTPDYMSPEQAEADGARIGPRSDVWSLGVMLFELLTGRLPFAGGKSWRTLLQVIKADVPRPRAWHPHAPPELEAVCLKALEKDPDRRYVGAAEFAEELRRWLRGEPVQARRHGPAYRLWRWAARRKGAVATAAVVLALAVWVAGSTIAARQARARLLSRLRGAAGLSLEGALAVRRMGMLAAMATHQPALEAAYRDAEAELEGSSPEPAYCRGRFARALMDETGALVWQAQALAADPGFAPALYERAVLEARAYGRRRVQVRDALRAARGAGLFAGGPTGPARATSGAADPSRADLEAADAELRTHKATLIASLQALRERAGTGPPGAPASGGSGDRTIPDGTSSAGAPAIGPAALACVEGLLAAHSGADSTAAYPEARGHFARAIAADPRLEEAYEGLFEAAAACAEWDAAIDACTRGLEQDRGYVPHLLHRGAMRIQIGGGRLMRGEDAASLFAAAAEDFSRAIDLDPNEAAAWSGRGTARLDSAVAAGLRGGETGEALGQAVADFVEAIKLAPLDPAPLLGRGNARINLSRIVGADEDALLAGAESDYGAVLALDSGQVEAWRHRGMARMARADGVAGRGGEAGPAYELALADFAAAIERHAGDSGAWKFRGMAWRNWGSMRATRGEDPRELLEHAVRDFEKSLALDGADAEAWQTLGKTRMNLGEAARRSGGDPVPGYRGAAEACTRAVELNPAYVDGWLTLGHIHGNWGAHRTERGEDPTESYRAASQAYGRALERSPKDAAIWRGLGTLHVNWGAWRLKRGEDPTEQFRAGEEGLGQALALEPDATEAHLSLAMMRINRALWVDQHGGDPGPHYAAAVADLDVALARNPALAEARLTRGRARMRWGVDRGHRGEDPLPQFAGAVADFDELLRLAPGQPQATAWREQVRAWIEQIQAGTVAPEWMRALAGADAALRGGDAAAARRGYEEAIAAAPADASALDPNAREALVGANYNLACLLALAVPAAASEADAATLRDEAFARLGRAVDLGWKDAGHLREDPDLEALRGDARWEALLGRMK